MDLENQNEKSENEKSLDIAKQMSESIKNLGGYYSDVIKNAKILAVEKQKLKKLTEDNNKEYRKLQKEYNKLESLQRKGVSLSKKQLERKIKIKERQEEITESVKNERDAQQEIIDGYTQKNQLLRKNLTNIRAISSAVGKDLGKGFFNVLKYSIEQSKEIKKTQRDIGFLTKESEGFYKNINRASISTSTLGLEAKDLAKIQGVYSDELGRSVMLSKEGLIAIGEIAEGTGIGAENAAIFASSMDNFGISVIESKDIIQETVDLAHTMGVNSNKVVKNMAKNLQIASKFHLKGGVRDLTKMTLASEKFKFSLDNITSMAEKLFDIEGAVEMSAQLQVLGGEFSKLADPFSLMYKARHDLKGLQEDVIKAAKSTAQFNKETGEFDISGLELQRLRKIAEATGMEFKDLTIMAKEAAKKTKIETEINGKIDPDVKEFITGKAVFDKKKGGFTINIDGEDRLLKSLTNTEKNRLSALAEEQKTLAQRAEESKTVDEMWKNLMNTFKSSLLPFLQGIQKGMAGPLKDFTEYMKEKKVFTKIRELGETIGKFVGDNPLLALGSILGTGVLFNVGKWYLSGKMLRKGFDSSGGMLGDLFGGSGGSGGSGGGKQKRPRKNTFSRNFKASRLKAGRKTRGLGKGILGAGKGLGKGILGAGKGLGKGLGKGIGKSLLKKIPGVSILAGLAFGAGRAMEGDWLGALGELGSGVAGTIPGLGTLASTGIDAALIARDMSKSNEMQDFVARPGQAPIPFSSKDTLVGAKPGGPIDKMLSTSEKVGPNMEISFKPLEIKFSPITLVGSDGESKINLSDNPTLIRELSSLIQQELRMSIGGGKLSPNPV